MELSRWRFHGIVTMEITRSNIIYGSQDPRLNTCVSSTILCCKKIFGVAKGDGSTPLHDLRCERRSFVRLSTSMRVSRACHYCCKFIGSRFCDAFFSLCAYVQRKRVPYPLTRNQCKYGCSHTALF